MPIIPAPMQHPATITVAPRGLVLLNEVVDIDRTFFFWGVNYIIFLIKKGNYWAAAQKKTREKEGTKVRFIRLILAGGGDFKQSVQRRDGSIYGGL
jgi:hypothetical protein